MTKQNRQEILKAMKIGLSVNLLLTVLKLLTGILGESQALISDGLNSSSDVFISVMLLVVLKIATKKPDHDHPYGHEKFEGLAYFILGIVFLLTSVYIIVSSTTSIIGYLQYPQQATTPHIATLIVSIVALLIKFSLFKYYQKVSKKYSSPTLKADAKNHMLDVWATLFSVVGIGLAQLDLVIFDYLAAIIIGFFILRLALQILKESVTYLVDQSPSAVEVQDINKIIMSVEGVMCVDDLKVRRHMTQKYVDVEIGVIANLTLKKAHQIAENVHHKVEDEFEDVLHCMVHVNPIEQ